MTYKSLDDVGAEFVRAAQVETNSLFVQGEIVLQATAQGFDIDEVCAHCAGLANRSKRTVYRRYKVARTFVKPHPALTTSFELHAICSDLIDYRGSDPDVIASQIEAAQKWLDMAAAEGWSTRQLKMAMKENGDDPDKGTPEVVTVKAVIKSVWRDDAGNIFAFEIWPSEFVEDNWSAPLEVNMTLVKAPAQESEAA